MFATPTMHVTDEKEGVGAAAIETALRRFGSPLYLVFESTLRSQYRLLKSALERQYPHSAIAYSFKTNYLRRICEIFKDEGARAEVVSGFEYTLAKRLGYTGGNIIFNGPHKTDADLREAFLDGALVNLDSAEEIERAHTLAISLNEHVPIGLRLSSSALAEMVRERKQMRERGREGLFERFGFNLENGDAEAAIERIQEVGSLRLLGYHMHIASESIADMDIFKLATEMVADFAKRMQEKTGIAPSYIDMGGGFIDPNLRKAAIRSQFSLDEFLETTSSILTTRFSSLPLLLFEPGRFLVARSMLHAVRVVSIKKLGPRRIVTVDSSSSFIPTARLSRHDIYALHRDAPTIESVVVGSSCTGHDVFGTYQLPELREGHILVVKDCGAYALSRSSQFIFPRPAVVWVDEKGAMSLARRAETADDLTRLDA